MLLEQEITVLSQVLDHPKRPIVVMIGGAKVDDKQGLIAKGFAKEYTYKQNYQKQELFKKAEEKAKADQRGISRP